MSDIPTEKTTEVCLVGLNILFVYFPVGVLKNKITLDLITVVPHRVMYKQSLRSKEKINYEAFSETGKRVFKGTREDLNTIVR